MGGAWAITRAYLGWARRASVLDTPGARSSHTVPTPTGGGVGIVAGMTVAFLFAVFGVGVGSDWCAVAAALPVLTLLGYLDDRRALPVLPRLCGQFAAALTVAWVALGAAQAPPWLFPCAVLALVWFNNAFNFMDGIDGLAASQAAFMAAAAALLLGQAGAADSRLLLPGVAGAALGFLALNWPPARLFMGDAGSQPLGFALAGATLVTVARGELALPVWLILWTAFLADATVTLFARALGGKPVFRAHREHAYQRLARLAGAHLPVTLGYLALNLLWLLPLAWLAHAQPRFAWPLLGVAAVPTCLAVVRLRRVIDSDKLQ